MLGAAIRFDRWRHTEWGQPDVNELHDLEGDPREWTNLAQDPKFSAVVRRATQLLAEVRLQAAAQKRTVAP